ncbi:DeoR/GlpR family DNA-binding transcription regulator [Pseudoroseomonas cervicalis]|uniref:Transcriptional regulator, DeoR family n=1 Tax=Pseudoroseomonas cervicalis ATCC 49957 TaxID=525371 RepID=D5RJX1_9PROT|nr:DeoR/GlpR family DNA-binding transcription regulator [Pseudoroseomonas cervicalis]EFH12397.1 transcriptional regulator, DeoR family [Pseudoroseomonas cervicalis ATCC 49957]
MRQKRARRDEILTALEAGSADVEALAARFGVSASTIRRDLQDLSAQHPIARTYGGAMLAGSAVEQSLGTRATQRRPAKAAIAEAALALLAEGETLILDGGSTVEALGRRLPGWLSGRRLRVITNNLPLIPVLAGAPGLELIVLGGVVRPISMGTTGPFAEQSLRQMSADRLFTSADGLLPGYGLCEATPEQVSLKSLMMRQAASVVVLADASKLGQGKQPFWAPLPPGAVLVTDAAEAECAPYRAEGLRVIRVAPPG